MLSKTPGPSQELKGNYTAVKNRVSDWLMCEVTKFYALAMGLFASVLLPYMLLVSGPPGVMLYMTMMTLGALFPCPALLLPSVNEAFHTYMQART